MSSNKKATKSKETTTELVKTTQKPTKTYDRHNYKLTEEDKKDIVLNNYLDKSKDMRYYLMNKYNISEKAFYNVINQAKETNKIEKYINEEKKNFNKKLEISIDKAIKRINDKLESDEDIQLNQLSTTLGILYDKSRLEQNLSTSNNSININIKVEK